jgi:hypothetical protein
LHHDAKEEPNEIKSAEECLSSELCIDQYLWSLYQRARKVDTIKVVEQKKASVVKKGKLRTIIQKIVKLVREDFTWKDPADLLSLVASWREIQIKPHGRAHGMVGYGPAIQEIRASTILPRRAFTSSRPG